MFSACGGSSSRCWISLWSWLSAERRGCSLPGCSTSRAAAPSRAPHPWSLHKKLARLRERLPVIEGCVRSPMFHSTRASPEIRVHRPPRSATYRHEYPRRRCPFPPKKPRPLTVVQRENSAATQGDQPAPRPRAAVRRHRRTSQTTLLLATARLCAHSSSREVFQFFCTLGCRLCKTIPAVQKRGCAAFGVGIKAAVRFPEFDPGALRLEHVFFRFAESFDMSRL